MTRLSKEFCRTHTSQVSYEVGHSSKSAGFFSFAGTGGKHNREMAHDQNLMRGAPPFPQQAGAGTQVR